MASIYISGTYPQYITAYVTGLDTSYASDDRYIEWSAGGTYNTTTYLDAYVASGGNATLSGLASNTTYTIQAKIYYNNGANSVTLSTTAKTRPNTFSWTYAKASGNTFNLYASEWNNFTNSVNQVRLYKGYSSYSFSTAYSGNTFTAAMYNQAVTAIQGISGYGGYLSSVSAGNTVYASQLNTLVSELNAVP